MAGIQEYTAAEALNRVLNTDEDALKVDIDNVTLKTEGSDINIEVHTDKAEDSMLMFSHTVKTGTGGTSYVPLVDADGHLQVDTLSSALPAGAATAANQATIIGHVDGVETLLTAIDTVLDTIKIDTEAIETAVELLDNAVDGNYLNVNANIAGTDFVGGAGAVAAGVQRVTLASDDPAVTDLAAMEVLLGTIDEDTNAIKGHVDGIETLITSTNSKIDTFDAVLDSILTKNTEIDTVLDTIKTDTEEIEGAVETIETAIKAEDAAHSSGDTGIMALTVRNDSLATLGGADGDYAALQVNKTGALNVTETVGHLGAIFEDGTDNITSKKVIAIQFLEDTTFTTLTPEDSSYIGTASSNGDAIDTSNTFPQGMTIFGRWTGFRLATGTIVAYQGDW
jgi:archaellum component FlaC